MKSIQSLGYKVFFESENFTALKKFFTKHPYSRYVILCDENTLQHCVHKVIAACNALKEAEIIEIEAGETSKSLDIAAQVWNSLLEQNAGRDTLLINIGGGVVSDLGGFCASVYKRGIDFITIPTSLLAMADASIGGKTGIDFSGIKNSIGSFAQPKAVFIHRNFLETLEPRQLMNGLAEVYKIALIADNKFWNSLSEIKLQHMIEKSVALKNTIVLKDPYEKGLRKVLNFGHTIGHAIEAFALSQAEDLLHGEAIVAGMIIETHLAWQKKLISTVRRNEVLITFQLIFELPELDFSPAQLLPYLKQDKKNKGTGVNFSLIRGEGSCAYDISCTSQQIEKAIAYYQALLND